MKRIILTTFILASFMASCSSGPSVQREVTWSYSGSEGPSHWDKYAPLCTEGDTQSPVNILASSADAITPSSLLFFTGDSESVAKIENNGHYIKVTPTGSNKITIKGLDYHLQDVSIHDKSEHTIDGERSDMFVQFVYKNAQDMLAAVEVPVKLGHANEVFERLLDKLKDEKMLFNPSSLLPDSTVKYYHYIGSLTKPPCTQEVKWYIMQESITIDSKQLKAFRSLNKDNFRPLQSLNGRYIEQK